MLVYVLVVLLVLYDNVYTHTHTKHLLLQALSITVYFTELCTTAVGIPSFCPYLFSPQHEPATNRQVMFKSGQY